MLQSRVGIPKWANYCKVRQVLQSRTTFIAKWGKRYYKVGWLGCIAKKGSFFVLQSEASSISKSGSFYKVGHWSQSRPVQRSKKVWSKKFFFINFIDFLLMGFFS